MKPGARRKLVVVEVEACFVRISLRGVMVERTRTKMEDDNETVDDIILQELQNIETSDETETSSTEKEEHSPIKQQKLM